MQLDIMNITKHPVFLLTENEKIVLCVFNVFSMAFGLFGNIMVVAVLKLHQNSQGMPSTIILRSLAVSDILVLIIVQPLYVYSFFHIVDANLSQVVQASRWALVLASLLHLLVVSIDRYLAICKPTLYHQKLKHACSWCITTLFIVWCLTTVLGTGLALVTKSTARMIHGVVALFCFFVMVTLIVIHLRLFVVARRHGKKIEKEHAVKGYVTPTPTTDEESSKSHMREEHVQNHAHFLRPHLTFFRDLKAFKTTSIVCGAFLLSWIPLLVIGLIYMTTRDMNDKKTMLRVFPYVNTLAFLNSAQNPFIYSVKIHTFRVFLRKIGDRIRSLAKSTSN